MDFGGFLVLGIIWLLFNLIGQGKGRTARRRAPADAAAYGRQGHRIPPSRKGPAWSGCSASWSGASRRSRQAAGGEPPVAASKLPAPRTGEEEDVEERDSLEEPERVVSLETEVPRRERPEYDQDTEAEAIVQRRIEAARARDRALGKADHKAFDAKIRQEAADHTAVRRYTPAQLRDAIVWREILGPPVSERE